MTRIKVTVNTLDQANEIIEYWKNKEGIFKLEIVLKENTTTGNSDVVLTLNSERLAELISLGLDCTST